MDFQVEVSVILPTRNRARMLPISLQSLLAQTYPPHDYEILIVNDGSTDSTAEVARSFQDTYEGRVRYLHKPHSGLNASRNEGIRETRGKLIAFVDDDIEAAPGWLMALVEGARRNPDVGCFAGRILLRLEGHTPRVCGRESMGESELDLGDQEKETAHAWGANFMITRTAVEEVGLFNESLPLYGDETEWQHRFKQAGGRIVYLPAASVMHRRTVADLTPVAMLRRRYRMGKSWAVLSPYIERRVSLAGGLGIIISGLTHAARRRCWVGLLRAAYGLGHIKGAASLLLSGKGSEHVSWLPSRHRQGRDRVLGKRAR